MNILSSIANLLKPYLKEIIQAEVASFLPILLASIEADKNTPAVVQNIISDVQNTKSESEG